VETRTPSRGAPRPPGLLVAAVVLLVEALVALGFGVLEIVRADPSRLMVGLGVAILMLGYALMLGVLARGVWRGRRWSRGPAVATQLILLPVAWSFRGGETNGVFLALSVAAVAVLVGLLTPPSTRVLVGDPAQETGRAPEEGTPRKDDGAL
jgi:hypothetical protein